jgi:hypothetical protein
MERQTLSIMKACEAVGVSRRTIYNWYFRGQGRIRSHRRRVDSHLCRHVVARCEFAIGRHEHHRFHQHRHNCVNLARSKEDLEAQALCRTSIYAPVPSAEQSAGIALAHAELLVARSIDSANRARAEQVVQSVPEAMGNGQADQAPFRGTFARLSPKSQHKGPIRPDLSYL